MEQEALDVLFEFKESRRQRSIVPSDVCEIISGEFQFGHNFRQLWLLEDLCGGGNYSLFIVFYYL